MNQLVLEASPREIVGKKVKTLRADGKLPAVLYGHGLAPQLITISTHDFETTFHAAGQNTLLELKIEGDKTYNVLIHDLARDSVHDRPLHVDFYRVKMDEEIRTNVPLHFTGESTAVFQDGGSLLTSLEELEIETLPAHLPSSLEVDISVLDDFEKTITVADIPAPANVKILNDPEELIARVEPPRSDEELAELDSEIVEDIPGEEGAEGEAAEEGEDTAEGGEPEAESDEDNKKE